MQIEPEFHSRDLKRRDVSSNGDGYALMALHNLSYMSPQTDQGHFFQIRYVRVSDVLAKAVITQGRCSFLGTLVCVTPRTYALSRPSL